MKMYRKSRSSFAHKAYYIALFSGFAVLIVLMVMYGKQMRNRNEAAKQEINLDEVGNQAIQKTESDEAISSTEDFELATEETVTTEEIKEETKPTASVINYAYDGKEKLEWPVKGNIRIPFSMDTTVYFETLDQYKCNPGILIEAKEGQGVGAVTKCKVEKVIENDELGKQVILDLGNDYTVILGQLKDIKVKEDDILSAGDILGYVAEPTSYYTLEGSHLYMQMMEKENPVDPMKYLKE